MMDSQSLCSFLFVLRFLICFSFISCMEFAYPPSSFDPNDNMILVSGATRGQSEFGDRVIRLIDPDPVKGTGQNSTGRVQYAEPFQLWDPRTNMVTDFTTSFDFAILFGQQQYNSSVGSGGMALFITSAESLTTPTNSGGGWLGLFNKTIDGNSSNHMVAVEFDTFRNGWDPSSIHVGFDVNSIASKNTTNWNEDMLSDSTYYHRATISYNGTSKVLSVVVELAVADISGESETLNLTYNMDLSTVLPPKVFVGFSASSGQATPAQLIISWNFTSTMDPIVEGEKGFEMWKVWLIIAVVVFFAGVGLIVGIFWRNSRRQKPEEAAAEDYHDEEEGIEIDDCMDRDFAMGIGPKRFTIKALVTATRNFSEGGKLGQGGFGDVYKGYLADQDIEVAVKKVASNSKQGKKEYVSEVKTISRLRHRNLVQLIGWSHQNDNFLLVYEYMPNGSLDSHLYGKSNRLTWPIRYQIVKGLASALLYLHEEWEQCVIHRDIKPSNIMLDTNFNAKLGDFGLAKLLEHGLGSKTTVLAGTIGYLAPEYVITSKASRESDVFSFGVVALEVACGRKAVEYNEEEIKVVLSKWIWELNSNGKLLDAVDKTLNGDFNEDEMRCLLSVGLWCTHPDYKRRPSVRQAIQVLNFEAPLPILPSQTPVASYFTPVFSDQFDFTSSSEGTSQSTTFSTNITSNQNTLSQSFHPISSPDEVSALIRSF